VKAGYLLQYQFIDYDQINREQLAGVLTTNAGALQLARTGLGRECRVPDDCALTNNPTGLMMTFAKIADCLLADGRLAEMDHDTNAAISSYLNLQQFCQKYATGGTIVFSLRCNAHAALGMVRLGTLRQSLDAEKCRDIARTLESIDMDADSVEDILRQEKKYYDKNHNLVDKVKDLFNRKAGQSTIEQFTKQYKYIQLKRRDLMVLFAGRAYELENAKPVQKIEDLVPAFLKAVPKDPYGGTNMVYGRPIAPQ